VADAPRKEQHAPEMDRMQSTAPIQPFRPKSSIFGPEKDRKKGLTLPW